MIEALAKVGAVKNAKEHYEKVTELYRRDRDFQPSPKLAASYYATLKTENKPGTDVSAIQKSLDDEKEGGAFYCEYELFKKIYSLKRRECLRDHSEIQLALMTMIPSGGHTSRPVDAAMLYGETGTGKEMFAQSIHNASDRRDGPFVAVNCTALSKNLLESELFGYADSSFTGAKRGGKPGLFEIAHSGTIFLDEIGELPQEFQAQFLRVLQEKEIRRVGGDTVIPVDIRVIGATNRDLMERVEKGEFRRDLYYRLNVLNLMIPPLRDRGDDYLQIASSIYRNVAPDRSPTENAGFMEVMKSYSGYHWPGNVRELNNVVERICLLQKRGLSQELVLESLWAMARRDWPAGLPAPASPAAETLDQVERSQIQAAMANTLTAIDMGICKVQSALGGLGGCPFAPGASGNLSTEDLVWMLNEMGYDTGISFSPALAAAKMQKASVPGQYSGHHICVENETPCKEPGVL